jgi:hypothetical protein
VGFLFDFLIEKKRPELVSEDKIRL